MNKRKWLVLTFCSLIGAGLLVPLLAQDGFGTGTPPAKKPPPVAVSENPEEKPILEDPGQKTTPPDGKGDDAGHPQKKPLPKADRHGALELNVRGFVRHMMTICFAFDPSQLETEGVKNWTRDTVNRISGGYHPAYLLSDLYYFFHGLECHAKRNDDQRHTETDIRNQVTFIYLVGLNRHATKDEREFWIGGLLANQQIEPFILNIFNRPDCPWKAVFGTAEARAPKYAIPLEAGRLNPADFGYDSKLFKPVFDVVEKYCEVNREYNNKNPTDSGHTANPGWAEKTDCSGFVCQFINKLAQLANVPSPLGNNFPSSHYMHSYGQLVSSSFPPPNPRDLIQPGDVFVMTPPPPPSTSTAGHTGIFMGYDPSGNPLIAHSTPSDIESGDVLGHAGLDGVRIEIIPSTYRTSRWKGFYRMNGVSDILKKLTG